jgi:succinoglycan biosynthesis transport protein ExoP
VAVADVYRALWRHKWFIAILTAGLAAAVWFLTSRQQPIYQASTLIRVQQQIEPGNTGETLRALEAGERLAETYAKAATTDTIAQQIYADLDQRVPVEEIAGEISAEPVRDLDLLWIRVRSPIPARAQLIANAAPAALQDFIEETATQRDQVIVYEQAGLPREPASPNLTLNIAIAVLLGLLFNGALALVIEAVSDRITNVDELERLAGKPILAVVPNLQFAQRPREEIEPPLATPARRARGAAGG